MPFRPQVNDQLAISGTAYHIAEHPAAPGVPYGQAGRRAIVYQVVAGEDRQALKVFKPRFRAPALVLAAQNLAPHASLPGLQVCERQVLTPERHSSPLQQYPDLAYAVLMPWIEGPTWMEAMIQKQALTPEESLALARSLAGTLAQMEEQGLAHCDLAGPNVMLPPEGGVVLVDVEEMYGPEFEQPEVLPSGSSGYGHRTAGEGLWGPDADRFAGAVLLAEMLGWCDERVREKAWGEQYFAGEEVQEDTERYRLLKEVLKQWGESMAKLFEQAWQSKGLSDCPAFGEWLVVLAQALWEKEAPVDPNDAKKRLARAGMEKAEALIAVGEEEQALKELADAYRLSPQLVAETYARALVQQATQREESGDPGGALTAYRRALRVAPEGGSLWQEIAAVAYHLEDRLPKTRESSSADTWRELPATRIILWSATMIVGWAVAIGITLSGNYDLLFALVGWAVAGTLAGFVQWLAAREFAPVAPWWILVALIGWVGCWAIGTGLSQATRVTVRGGISADWSMYSTLWWSVAWQSTCLLNAIFNGTAAVLLLGSRPVES